MHDKHNGDRICAWEPNALADAVSCAVQRARGNIDGLLLGDVARASATRAKLIGEGRGAAQAAEEVTQMKLGESASVCSDGCFVRRDGEGEVAEIEEAGVCGAEEGLGVEICREGEGIVGGPFVEAEEGKWEVFRICGREVGLEEEVGEENGWGGVWRGPAVKNVESGGEDEVEGRRGGAWEGGMTVVIETVEWGAGEG